MLSYSSGRRPGSGTDERPFPPTRAPRGRSRSALLLSLLVTSACGGAAQLQRGIVSQHLGHGSRYDLDEAVNSILHAAGYSVQHRTETPSRIYYETSWAA